MKTNTIDSKTLQALVIDRHFGEISAEAAELLEIYLTHNPEAMKETERVLSSLGVMGQAVMPVLPSEEMKVIDLKANPARKGWATGWLARAAGLMLLAGAGGFLAGRSMPEVASSAPPEMMVAEATEVKEANPGTGPWARYRLEVNARDGGMQVVRVGSKPKFEEVVR
ncbi:hypothetical protein FEM03_03930 [Phragmitibacter flavus]|uniref:Uncharacterized protein n=1 Tax=Phragmitibacter flavus TaxID=2576071 RepID=A0A5R8KHT7_9BACT|nr:hypothetical protein [Phragmitibacter flavus]TLD71884.1 hypothetical protein FEM03_03930 [Phragmitibacter flavus]